jgi:hypothetical protein
VTENRDCYRVRCAYCGAPSGYACVTWTGRPRMYGSRWFEAHACRGYGWPPRDHDLCPDGEPGTTWDHFYAGQKPRWLRVPPAQRTGGRFADRHRVSVT